MEPFTYDVYAYHGGFLEFHHAFALHAYAKILELGLFTIGWHCFFLYNGLSLNDFPTQTFADDALKTTMYRCF